MEKIIFAAGRSASCQDSAKMVLTTESLVADKPEPPAPAAPGGDMGGACIDIASNAVFSRYLLRVPAFLWDVPLENVLRGDHFDIDKGIMFAYNITSLLPN